MRDHPTEQSRYINEVNREHALRAHERNDLSIADARRAAIKSAYVAIRALLLVNGGAVVALLAFAGAFITTNGAGSSNLDVLISPIRWFAFGVGFSALTAAFAYLVNMLDSDILASVKHSWEHPYVIEQPTAEKIRRPRNVLHKAAIVLALVSLVSFFAGIMSVTSAISAIV